MEITRVSDLRPRFIWDILDDAFDLYRERFALLCGIAAVAYLPVSVLTIALTASGINGTGSKDEFWAYVGPLAFNLPLLAIASVFKSAATAVAVSDCFEGQTTTILSAYQRAFRRPFALIATALALGFLYVIGLIPLGFGTLAVFLYGAFWTQAMVLEDRGFVSAWRRSRDLATTDWTRLAGVMLLVYGLAAVLQFALSSVIELAFTFLPHGAGDAAARLTEQNVLKQTAGSIAELFLMPLQGVSLTLLYLDLRVRREGIDLAALAEERGLPLAADPFGDKSSFRVAWEQKKKQKRESRRTRQSSKARPDKTPGAKARP